MACPHKRLHLLPEVQRASSSFCCGKQKLVFSALNLGKFDSALEARLTSVGKITILSYICVVSNDFHYFFIGIILLNLGKNSMNKETITRC